MSSADVSGSAEKEYLLYTLGGTITSRKYPDQDAVLFKRPEQTNIRELLDRAVASLAHSPSLPIAQVNPKIALDSADFNGSIISEIVQDMRIRMTDRVNIREQESVQRPPIKMIVWTGTDQAADLANAIVNGVLAKHLQKHFHSILITCSQHHLGVKDTDAIPNAAAAFLLSQRDELRGKVALVMGGEVFPARGIEKIFRNGPQLFASRYPRIGTYEWVSSSDLEVELADFYSTSEPKSLLFDSDKDRGEDVSFDAPSGDAAVEYRLVQGVEYQYLGSTSDYNNVLEGVRNQSWTEEGGKLRGLVLGFPGDNNARTTSDERNILEYAANGDIPVVAVGAPISKWQYETLLDLDEPYEGFAPNIPGLIPGYNFTPTEARIMLSALIAEARTQWLLLPEDSRPEEHTYIIAYVHDSFQKEPLRCRGLR
jgi:hypothetical protein